MDKKLKTFLNKLADIGVKVSQDTFNSAPHTNLSDVVVSVKWEGDYQLVIQADGNEVAFLEFGTGSYYSNDSHEWSARLNLIPTTLMKHPENEYWFFPNNGNRGGLSWFPKDKKGKVNTKVYMTRGNPPARAMYKGWAEMRNKIDDIAKEVFR